MRTATVVITFTDAREGVLRNIGDVFNADDERAAQLEELGYVTLAPEKAAPKATRKKSTAK